MINASYFNCYENPDFINYLHKNKIKMKNQYTFRPINYKQLVDTIQSNIHDFEPIPTQELYQENSSENYTLSSEERMKKFILEKKIQENIKDNNDGKDDKKKDDSTYADELDSIDDINTNDICSFSEYDSDDEVYHDETNKKYQCCCLIYSTMLYNYFVDLFYDIYAFLDFVFWSTDAKSLSL